MRGRLPGAARRDSRLVVVGLARVAVVAVERVRGISAVELHRTAVKSVGRPVPGFTVANLTAWLLGEGLAVVDGDGLLRPTVRALDPRRRLVGQAPGGI